MYHSRQNNRRRKGRNRRRRSQSTFPWKSVLAGTALTTILGAAGFLAYQDSDYITADAAGCFEQSGNQYHTVAIIDSSEPRFDSVQRRDLMAAFRQLYSTGLQSNERFSVVTTEEAHIGSIPAPVLVFCRSARTKQDLEDVGAASATKAFLVQHADKFAKKVFEPALTTIFSANPDDSMRQERESPILEQIQSVGRMPGFSSQTAHRRLILVSDLFQSTSEAQFCVKRGHLPKFKNFKQKAYFNQVGPVNLSGVDVKIYMLVRGGYGGSNYPYCNEDELRAFWSDYFADAGASNVEIIRLRMG